jgi:hypothetical protein
LESAWDEMAKSSLVWANEQIRFLSRYFLQEEEELIHGADIYAGYMNDRDFVETLKHKTYREIILPYNLPILYYKPYFLYRQILSSESLSRCCCLMHWLEIMTGIFITGG